MKDYYATLGVAPNADLSTLRAAWRALVFATHPDRNPDDPTATARCALANEAWSVLSEPAERAAYDAARRGARGTWAEPPPPPPRWWTPPPDARPGLVRAGTFVDTPLRRRAPDPDYWDEQAWLEEQFGRWAWWTRHGTPRGSANTPWSGYRRRARRP